MLLVFLKKKKKILKLNYAEVCFNTVSSTSNDVYDGGMVFYNGLFLDDKLFTLHSSVFAILFYFLIFVPSKSTNSIFAKLESP